MNLVLPTSKIEIILKDSLTYGEYKTIEGVMLSGAKGQIVGQSFNQQFDGTVIQAYQKKMIEVFIISARNGAEEVQINTMIDGLAAEDGIALETAVQKQYEGIKKKL